MKLRRLALLGCAALLSCDGAGGSADDGASYRTTFGYFLTTGNTSQTSVGFAIISEDDISFYESQTGADQLDNTCFIRGQVQNSAGQFLAGTEVEALNDTGLSVGQLYYQSVVTGAYGSAVPYTAGSGRFIVINVPEGRINLRCKAGADGNLFVQAVDRDAVFAQVRATSPKVTPAPTWTGTTLNLGSAGSALPGGAEPTVLLQLVGATGNLTPSNLSGTFTLGGVAARNTFLMKAAKTDFVTTYTYVRTEDVNLTAGAGGGDVLIASIVNRDAELVPAGITLTPGTGILRGRVLDGAGGFAVEARNAVDAAVGEVRYGDNGDGGRPNNALTGTHPNGIFYIYNVPPGQVFVRAGRIGVPTSHAATTYVHVYPDSITVPLDLTPLVQTVPVISISGFLQSLTGFAVPEGTVVFQGLGLGDQTDVFGECSIPNVPTQHQFIVRSFK